MTYEPRLMLTADSDRRRPSDQGMFGVERALAAGHGSPRPGHQMMYHNPGKEVIETSVVATLAACGIDRKQRVGLRATDRKSGAARGNENACAKRRIVA